MKYASLPSIIFYQIEKAIKRYRTYGQKQINKAGFDITIDQWLLLKTIAENKTLTQREIGEIIFKDFASVTRMIEILVKKGYLTRSFHNKDKRLKTLNITDKGNILLLELQTVISQNRAKALENIEESELENMTNSLQMIINNCQ